ncbi:hypothetical protein [Armatimonas sp.]|uniref:hypothetical protein n=1 Tax=Armatimonas sp. TaxID=1872638 RepID=UPI00286ACF9B|nr:hypothetical protein [Armatimonas sp.]
MRPLFSIAATLCCPVAAFAQTVYPEKVVMPEKLRAKLASYSITLPKSQTPGAFFSLSKQLDSLPMLRLESDPALFPSKYEGTKGVLPPMLLNPIRENYFYHWTVPDGAMPLPTLLDGLAEQAQIGWTVKERKGTFSIRFVRLAKTRDPDVTTSGKSVSLNTWLEPSPQFPESVSVPQAFRDELASYRVKLPDPPKPVLLATICASEKRVRFTSEPTLHLVKSWAGVQLPPVLSAPFKLVGTHELPLSELLDQVTQRSKVGWTAKRDKEGLVVEFVRLAQTPNPVFSSLVGGLLRRPLKAPVSDIVPGDVQTESPQSYPESVSVPEVMRKQLDEFRVNVNLVDRNGVGALLALLDARVDHQFDPALKLSKVSSGNLLTADIQSLQARDPEWLYPGLRLQKVTIKANGVALPTALDMLTQSLGVGWTAETQGERILVRIVRLRSTPSPVKMLKSSLETIHAAAEQLPREPNGLVQTPPNAYLKEMVSLELENASVRAALEALLRTTPRRFELSPDAGTLKRSFRFESVSLSSALNLVCDSYNVIWSLERDSKGGAFLSIRKRGEVPSQK